MDFSDAETHNELIRLDAAAISFALFIGAIISGLVYGNLTYAIAGLTFAFIIVGFSVAYQWRNELAKHDIVEAEPLQSLLIGSVVITGLQVGFGYFSFGFSLFPSLLYGVICGASYVFSILFISFYNLPGEGYKTRTHPKKNSREKYVFEEYHYISLVEEEALKNSDNSGDA